MGWRVRDSGWQVVAEIDFYVTANFIVPMNAEAEVAIKRLLVSGD